MHGYQSVGGYLRPVPVHKITLLFGKGKEGKIGK
jgi:hypothetical protein